METRLEKAFAQYLELQTAQLKHDASGTPTNIPPHGPVQGTNQYGTFATPGLTPGGFSTLTRPLSISDILGGRMAPSRETSPIRWTLTGQTDDITGSNPDDSCGEGVAFGLTKTCRQSRTFGEMKFQTRELNVANLDRIRDAADLPIVLLNSYLNAPNPLLPALPIPGTGEGYNDAKLKINAEAIIGSERSLVDVLINGNNTLAPAQANPGFISEPTGFLAQIKTGHTDLLTGVACPAVDSIVRDWGADLGASATAASDPRDFVRFLGDIMYSLVTNARKFGNADPGWSLLMHPDFWRELTNYWPCNFTTTRCKTAVTTPREGMVNVNIDPNVQEDIRNAMLNDLQIVIDGIAYPVTLDDSMTRTTVSENLYKYDLAIVPWNFVDFEFKPMNGPEAMRVYSDIPAGEFELWNNGMWLATHARKESCLRWSYTSQFRTHLATPQLAARITNISAAGFLDTRDPFPGQSRYKDGGSIYAG